MTKTKLEKLTTADIVNIIEIMSDIIIENEVYFCELDSVAGDGDFGMSVAKGFKEVKKSWSEIPRDDIGAFLKETGMIVTEYCGGASGPIWGSAFRGAAKSAKAKEEVNVAEFADMLETAVAGIQKRGGAKLGDKTLLDALIPATEAVKKAAADQETIDVAMTNAAKAAQEGAEKTKEMVASKGRATYVGDRSLSHPDAGAMALGIIFDGICKKFLG